MGDLELFILVEVFVLEVILLGRIVFSSRDGRGGGSRIFLVFWDCYFILRGRKIGINVEGRFV